MSPVSFLVAFSELWQHFFGFIFQSSSFFLPEWLSSVHVWWLGWPILEHLGLLHIEELWCGGWSMRSSTFLLKNLPPHVVWNVMGSKNFLILQAVDVSIHSADLSHATILDVTPNHDFSSTRLDRVLGESSVHAGSNRSSAVFCTDWDAVQRIIKKSTFYHFSTVHPFCKLWALANATQFLLSST